MQTYPFHPPRRFDNSILQGSRSLFKQLTMCGLGRCVIVLHLAGLPAVIRAVILLQQAELRRNSLRARGLGRDSRVFHQLLGTDAPDEVEC